MKIFIKYKTDGYSYPQKNLDTDRMYYFNGTSYEKLRNWLVIINCIKENYPIVVLLDQVGEFVSDGAFADEIECVINPSAIAMVFPVIQVGLGDEEKVVEPEISDLVDTYVGSTNKDGITS